MTDKEKIKAIIKQYADKGERLLEEAYENGEHASTTGYWDGFGDCANLLLRELDDMQEEPVSEDLDKEIDNAHKLFYEEVGWNSDEGARAYVADWFAHYFANWQKQQLMSKAVDVTIAIPYQNGYGGYTQLVDSKEGLPFGENLKVLVIKED